MPIYALGDVAPSIADDAFVHPDAVVIGDVVIGAGSSVWPQAVLRGDYGRITVGARSNVQDGAVIHATQRYPTVIGDDVVIGHLAHAECCTIEDGALVGSSSVVLHRVVIGARALVGAGALVTNDTVVPPGALALGIPARIREGEADQAEILRNAREYAQNAQRYLRELRRV